MEERKRKGRRAYLDSYQDNGEGKYVYTGKLYACCGADSAAAKREFRRAARKLWVLCLLLLAVWIPAGCIRAPGMSGCFYVLIPYVAGLAAGVRVCWGMGRLTAGGGVLKEYEYEGSVQVLPKRAAVTAACAGLCLAGELIFTCRNGLGGLTVGFWAFLAAGLAEMAVATAVFREARVLKSMFSVCTETP